MENLKELRTKKGMTQIAVAKAVGVSLTSYQIWERGGGKPSEENLKKLKAVLGINK